MLTKLVHSHGIIVCPLINISNGITYRNGNAKSVKVHAVLRNSAVGALIVDITGKKEILQLATKSEQKYIAYHADSPLFQDDAICRTA